MPRHWLLIAESVLLLTSLKYTRDGDGLSRIRPDDESADFRDDFICKGLKGVLWKPIAELRCVTCHMGSHLSLIHI